MGDETDYFAGIDIGSTMTKVVIMGDRVDASLIGPTGPEHRKLANRVMEEALASADLVFDDLSYVVATGYGRINVPFADRQVTEITCHAKGLHSLLPTCEDRGRHRRVRTARASRSRNGKVVSFVMNDKCAAGTGRFLEVIADALGVPLDSLGELSLSASKPAVISNTCTVFAEAGGNLPACGRRVRAQPDSRCPRGHCHAGLRHGEQAEEWSGTWQSPAAGRKTSVSSRRWKRDSDARFSCRRSPFSRVLWERPSIGKEAVRCCRPRRADPCQGVRAGSMEATFFS